MSWRVEGWWFSFGDKTKIVVSTQNVQEVEVYLL